MSNMDPVSDLLARIRNAHLAKHDRVDVPTSRLKTEVCRILKEEGFVSDFRRASKRPQDELEIDLKYSSDRRGAIIGIKRESTPGRRVYVGADEIPRVRHGLGVAIISTSQGVLADHDARKKRVGGELLLTVW